MAPRSLPANSEAMNKATAIKCKTPILIRNNLARGTAIAFSKVRTGPILGSVCTAVFLRRGDPARTYCRSHPARTKWDLWGAKLWAALFWLKDLTIGDVEEVPWLSSLVRPGRAMAHTMRTIVLVTGVQLWEGMLAAVRRGRIKVIGGF